MYSDNRFRQIFSAFSAEYHDRPEDFLGRVAHHAPETLAGFEYLGLLEKTGRALVQLKPRQLIECLYGQVPTGFLGLLSRLGGDPLPSKETYRKAFELFADPRHRQRAKVLGQLPGRVTAEHITVVAKLDDALVHRVAVHRTKPAEVDALNAFARMIVELCNATPETIKHSLDKLNLDTKGVGMDEWARGWLGRQVRLPFDPPIPSEEPDLKLRLGVELDSLGRRFRNCAASRKSFTFLNERVLYEVVKPGEQAVVELLRLTTGDQTNWACEDLRGKSNRRVSPELATWVQSKLDQHGILYQSLTPPAVEEQALHKLLDHTTPFAWDMRRETHHENGDADIDRMLDELEQEVHGQEAA